MPASKVERNGDQFRKGRSKTGGRKKGSPNKATREVKEFMLALVDDTEVQEAVRQKILKGDATAFFKATEMVHGKPRQSVELNEKPMNVHLARRLGCRLSWASPSRRRARRRCVS
jgi:hypothetical protein